MISGEAAPLSLAALNMTLNETLQLLKDLQLPPLEMVESEATQVAIVALYSLTGAAALLLNALQIYILCTGRRYALLLLALSATEFCSLIELKSMTKFLRML